MIITGVGTRDAPADERLLLVILQIGEAAQERGWLLRSGGATGMDTLFENAWSDNKEIFIHNERKRKHGVNGTVLVTDPAILKSARNLARKIHPKWSNVGFEGKKLHTRNIFQVLGEYMDSPSDCCIYYATIRPDGEVSGGTRTAVELAKQCDIPTFNLLMTDDIIRLGQFLEITWEDDSLILETAP